MLPAPGYALCGSYSVSRLVDRRHGYIPFVIKASQVAAVFPPHQDGGTLVRESCHEGVRVVSDEQQSAYKPTFTGELKRLIDVRGYNSARVASLIGCDVEYVLQVQRFNQVPTKTFATAADRVLRAEGSLLDLWQRERAALGRQQPRPLGTEAPEQADTVSPVKINLDQTRLELKAGVYVILRRLHITNQGNTPVTQLAAKVSVDRLPGNTAQSLAAYEADPLTWDELKLQAIYDHQ